jgi:hypothetical protein
LPWATVMVLESASVNNAHAPPRNKRMKDIELLLRAERPSLYRKSP